MYRNLLKLLYHFVVAFEGYIKIKKGPNHFIDERSQAFLENTFKIQNTFQTMKQACLFNLL